MPGGEIGGEEECRERDGADERKARQAERLTKRQRNQPQEGQGQCQPPKTRRNRADPGVADEERAGGERDVSDQQREKRPAVGACIVSI